ncbi:hypothetical protein C1I97_38860, partial [Streptomyces sp. NTH33]
MRPWRTVPPGTLCFPRLAHIMTATGALSVVGRRVCGMETSTEGESVARDGGPAPEAPAQEAASAEAVVGADPKTAPRPAMAPSSLS